MPLQPEELSLAGLPRSPLGGLKVEAVADLLRRAAWDYREALARNRQLEQQVEQLAARAAALEARIVELDRELPARRDPDELARTLLGSAQRAAREQRESARRDAELLLRKSRDRARKIVDDARKGVTLGAAELARLESLREETGRALRDVLEWIVAHGDQALTAGGPSAPPQPVVIEAYEHGLADGIHETVSQLRSRFDLGLIDGLQQFAEEVREKVDAAAAQGGESTQATGPAPPEDAALAEEAGS